MNIMAERTGNGEEISRPAADVEYAEPVCLMQAHARSPLSVQEQPKRGIRSELLRAVRVFTMHPAHFPPKALDTVAIDRVFHDSRKLIQRA